MMKANFSIQINAPVSPISPTTMNELHLAEWERRHEPDLAPEPARLNGVCRKVGYWTGFLSAIAVFIAGAGMGALTKPDALPNIMFAVGGLVTAACFTDVFCRICSEDGGAQAD